jgi:hypothetical protein
MQENNLPLTDLLNRHALGHFDRKELEGKIYQFLLDNYQRFRQYKWSKDDFMDYLCWLYPRLSRAIDRYKNTGASFDAYVASLIRWSIQEYRARETDHRVTENTCWKTQAAEMEVHSAEPVYMEPEPVYDTAPNPRQLLVLLLKSYHYVSDDLLRRIAPAVGIEAEKLGNMLEELREMRLNREDEIRGLQERIHCQYYRCLVFERRMALAVEGSAKHERMKGCLERARRRLAAMRKRLSSIKVEASNRQVANVLGVPKGTIDSSLYAIKNKWKFFDTPKDQDSDRKDEIAVE